MAEHEQPRCPYHSDKQCRSECQFTPPYFCWWDEELGIAAQICDLDWLGAPSDG